MRRRRHRAHLVATGALALAGSSALACATIAGLEGVAPEPWPADGGAMETSTDAPPDTGPVACDPSLCVTAIAADHFHTCVAIRDQPPRCWGANGQGQLGVPDASPDANPTPLALDLPPAALIGAGGFVGERDRPFTCATTGDGALHCWGDDTHGQTGPKSGDPTKPNVVDAGAAVTALGVGGAHACVVHLDGEVKCWGYGEQGQIGRASVLGDSTPKRVTLPRPGRAVAAGSFHTCVLFDDGTVGCFGLNNVQQLGHDAGVTTATVRTIPGLGRALHLALGWAHSCAVFEDGTMRCWGYDAHGQLGQGRQADIGVPAPVHLPAGRSATMACAGQLHSCALLDDATVACWGGNRRGQVGTGVALSEDSVDPPIVLTPTVVAGVTDVTAVACGTEHTCALHRSGRVTCWGTNEHGQLGRGTADPRPHPEPAPVVF